MSPYHTLYHVSLFSAGLYVYSRDALASRCGAIIFTSTSLSILISIKKPCLYVIALLGSPLLFMQKEVRLTLVCPVRSKDSTVCAFENLSRASTFFT